MGVGNSSLFEINGLKCLEKIGEGGYAKVYKAEWKGKIVAAKQLMEHIYFQDELTERFYAECETLRGLDHRNIVKMIDLLVPGGEIPPILITELLYCDLAAHIKKQTSQIPTAEVVKIMLDVAEGLKYLHNRPLPIAHRDLTSKNVLLTEKGTAKIADLGLARIFVCQAFASPSPGVLLYAAPETFRQNPVYDVRVDVFSFGVLLLEVINGHYPKPVPWMSPVTQNGEFVPEHQRRERDISEMRKEHSLSGLVLQCLANDSEARPTAEGIVRKLIQQKRKVQILSSNYNILKVVVLGANYAGKTCIIERFIDPLFDCENVMLTIGFQDSLTDVNYKGINCRLQLIDTFSFELFPYTLLLPVRADAILLVFDVCDRKSFERGIPFYIQLVAGNSKSEVSTVLVGNKVDLLRREVSAEEAQAFADENAMPYIETSAKTGYNIEHLFAQVTEMVLRST